MSNTVLEASTVAELITLVTASIAGGSEPVGLPFANHVGQITPTVAQEMQTGTGVTAYTLVEATSKEALAALITTQVGGGYSPYGAPIVNHSGSLSPTLVQALIQGAPASEESVTLTGAVTGSGTGTVATALTNDIVTNAKLANVATATFKGRTTASTGDPEDLTVAQAKTLLNLTGTNSGDQTITLTGVVTGSGTGSFATVFADSPTFVTPSVTTSITVNSGSVITDTTTGLKIATSTAQKLAFHNSTPVIQRAGAAQAAAPADAATNVAPYGYSQAQADAIVTLLNEIRAALVEKGLIKGAA